MHPMNSVLMNTFDRSFIKTDLKFTPLTASKTIFVGDLSFFCKEIHLYNLFQNYGPVEAVRIRKGKQGITLMHGFVEMENANVAANAVRDIDNALFMGRNIRAQVCNPNGIPSDYIPKDGYQVHFSFVATPMESPFLITEEVLRNIFEKFGEIVDVSIKRYMMKKPNRHCGYGFVYYKEKDSSEITITTLKNKEVNGILFDCQVSHRHTDNKVGLKMGSGSIDEDVHFSDLSLDQVDHRMMSSHSHSTSSSSSPFIPSMKPTLTNIQLNPLNISASHNSNQSQMAYNHPMQNGHSQHPHHQPHQQPHHQSHHQSYHQAQQQAQHQPSHMNHSGHSNHPMFRKPNNNHNNGYSDYPQYNNAMPSMVSNHPTSVPTMMYTSYPQIQTVSQVPQVPYSLDLSSMRNQQAESMSHIWPPQAPIQQSLPQSQPFWYSSPSPGSPTHTITPMQSRYTNLMYSNPNLLSGINSELIQRTALHPIYASSPTNAALLVATHVAEQPFRSNNSSPRNAKKYSPRNSTKNPSQAASSVPSSAPSASAQPTVISGPALAGPALAPSVKSSVTDGSEKPSIPSIPIPPPVQTSTA